MRCLTVTFIVIVKYTPTTKLHPSTQVLLLANIASDCAVVIILSLAFLCFIMAIFLLSSFGLVASATSHTKTMILLIKGKSSRDHPSKEKK
jgi:hypothetical protein